MEKELSEKPTLRLSNTVTRRAVPMTALGCDMLRAIRDSQVEDLKRRKGVEYNIPFPVVIHLLMKDYCELKNIEVTGENQDRGD